MIDNITTMIINSLLWRVFLTILDLDNHETVKAVNHREHNISNTDLG